MSWPGIIRFAADIHAAVSDGLYLAADLLDRGLDVYDDEGATVTVERPVDDQSFSPLNDRLTTSRLWDAETGDGLAAAADREARVSAVALLAERHRVLFNSHEGVYYCSCSRSFTDLEPWSEHVAELINDAIDSLIVPAIHPGGDLPASTPHSGAGDSALSSSAVRWPAPDDAGATPSAARGAGHPNTTTT